MPQHDLIVIPARYGSTRLPGKPLVNIAGRTLLERVVAVARQASRLAGMTQFVVATDDPRIEEHANSLGCETIITSTEISSGSGRAYAAARARDVRPDIVVNLQGDAPFIEPETIARLIEAARSTTAAVATPVTRMTWTELDRLRGHKIRAPFSGTTCIRAPDGRALWFSKAIVPAIRNEALLRQTSDASPVFQHLGLYAYHYQALEDFEGTPPTHYEQLEGLEQLRLLEMGLDILTVEVPSPRHAVSGIDTAEDVELAEALIAQFGDPYIP